MDDIDLDFILRIAKLAGLLVLIHDGEEAHTLVGTDQQWVRFGTRIHDERWSRMLTRRVGVEQDMLDAARGKRPMPDAQELRAWALKLGGQNADHAHHDSAIATLERLGFTYQGGEEWQPPVGRRPVWIDAEDTEAFVLEKAQQHLGDALLERSRVIAFARSLGVPVGVETPTEYAERRARENDAQAMDIQVQQHKDRT